MRATLVCASSALLALCAPAQLHAFSWGVSSVARGSRPARVGPHVAVATSGRSRVALMAADYYQTLGVGRSADERELKTAYRKLARQYHPDVNPSETAKERFQEINNAYEILSNPEMRARYDQFGEAGVKSGGMGGGGGGPGVDFDLGDIFESFFGGGGGGPGRGRRPRGPPQGEDLRFDLEIDFKTAVFGGERSVRVNHLETCTTCSGSGVKPGAKVSTCSTCGGTGVVTQVVSTILGRMQQQTVCPTCGGTGQQVEAYCGSCDGRGVVQRAKTLKVNIPKGIDSGQRLRVRAEGNAAPKGGQPGDLYVFITVQDDKQFRREGIDIYTDLAVSYIDAILGRRVKVPTIDGEVEIELPAGTQPGTTLRIEGKGVPKLNSPDTRGNQFIKVIVTIPRKLTKQERDAVIQLDELARQPR
ncbi:hypothetical protein KFE25_000724 [Diacronema lutheri]|uniref:Uncharacterized protein n=1 Tax=Diacronema lutheri TaxID=2081491 RepID=A0A8J6CH62_DIALT|nr:hypothetical protein KFE25_000724 [Diacronema lutheri]